MKNKKVLVISNTPFSEYNNNGKTFSSLLDFINEENLAQLYFNDSIPSFKICSNFFKVSDSDVLKNFISPSNLGTKVIRQSNNDFVVSHKDSKIKEKILGSNLATIARDLVWRRSKDYLEGMHEWISDFNPDLIFFVGGGDPFTYTIVNDIMARRKEKSNLYLYYTDDYIVNKSSSNSLLLKLYGYNSKFFTNLDITLKSCKSMFVISEKMKESYSEWYKGPIEVVMNSVKLRESHFKVPVENPLKIAYFGGLHLERWKSIKLLTKIFEEESIDFQIDLYVDAASSFFISKIKNTNVRSMNFINDSDKLFECMTSYDFLLHIESFDKKTLAKTFYSISTKIPEYLITKIPIIIFGPSKQASIDYLTKNDACIYIDESLNSSQLKEKLSPENINRITHNGFNLAKKNHLKSTNQMAVRKSFSNTFTN